jgi:hypothetical protein
MALPTVPDNTFLQLIVRGTSGEITDAENVLYGLYLAGGTPHAGGLTLADIATNFLTAWAGTMTGVMAGRSSFESCTVRIVDGFTGLGGHLFKVVSTQQWTIQASFLGTIGADPMPAFAAITVEKRNFASGRGRQGSFRIWGVPEVSVDFGDQLNAAAFANVNTVVGGHAPAFAVAGVGETDTVFIRTVNGPLINANPGHIPVFYGVAIEQFVPRIRLGSQITRKLARRRR